MSDTVADQADFSELDAVMAEQGIIDEQETPAPDETEAAGKETEVEAKDDNTDDAQSATNSGQAEEKGQEEAKSEETAPEALTLAELAQRKKAQEVAARQEKPREVGQTYDKNVVDVDVIKEEVRNLVLTELKESLVSDPNKFYEDQGLDRLDIAKQLLSKEANVDVPDHLKENGKIYQQKQYTKQLEEKVATLESKLEDRFNELEKREQMKGLRSTVDQWLKEVPEELTYLKNIVTNDRDVAIEEIMGEAMYAASLEGGEHLTLQDIAASYNKQIEDRAKLFGLVGQKPKVIADVAEERPIVTNQLTNQTHVDGEEVKDMTDDELMASIIRDLETKNVG